MSDPFSDQYNLDNKSQIEQKKILEQPLFYLKKCCLSEKSLHKQHFSIL